MGVEFQLLQSQGESAVPERALTPHTLYTLHNNNNNKPIKRLHVAAPVVHTAGYYANSGGAVHIVKREADADADADAAYYYSGYHHPYAYSGFRRFYGGFPYTAYNRGYFGGYYY